MLSATHISFSYGQASVLRDVSLSLAAGELVALFGPNGSGKSTLIRVLLGQLAPAGEVRWEDRPVAQWRRRELARVVAYLPQSPTFEAGQTVGEVLSTGRLPYWGAFGIESPRDWQIVESVARQLELADLLHRRMDEISGGQRQRVFLGRCLAQEPRALLLDEPSTFLDLRHQLDLHQLLQKLAAERKIGVLMASHDLNLTSMHADRAIILHDGQIAAQGTPEEVLQPDLLHRVYGVQMRRLDDRGRVHLVPEG